ncbi:Sodium/hydrogen exchanger [Zopfia rhizophila CBS 207.26]|uniref:Sodium/hydrogen exchanger n=1 Tax=Zopfia rhizophila CBS 207.26 TaxID=1314779 RepID=A0A6A6DAJ1_9PEZI|nr:Sodium/hydrogen exchanger [Zopfia rhizophila CBS 207.26]
MAQDIQVPSGFIQYHEPNIIQILVLISFFLWLSVGEWLSNKVFRAGLIGQIIVGLIYGAPIGGNVMHIAWQETFIALGYIGLILIIFEGAMAVRLDLLKVNFLLSLVAALIGVIMPIALSYLVLYLGFGYEAIETFIIGAALSVTSLVIGKASKDVNFSNTKVGSVLVSAAVFDDVSGLVMASVIDRLGDISGNSNVNLGWIIGRPNLASGLLAILTPLVTKWTIAPLFRSYIEPHFPRHKHVANVLFMVPILCVFLSVAAFAGTSVLFGSFLAGTFLTYLPSKHTEGPFVVPSREEAEQLQGKSPTFMHTFEKYFLDAQQYLMQPLFFASIGFAIPFKRLWTGEAIWKGLVFAILMMLGKVAVGFVVPLWDIFTSPRGSSIRATVRDAFWPSMLLGFAMVARGEIGLLVVQIGLNKTPYLSEAAFITAVWAIVLNTIIGPVTVGFLVKYKAQVIADGRWGIQSEPVRPSSRSLYSVRTERTVANSVVDVDVEAGKQEARKQEPAEQAVEAGIETWGAQVLEAS